MAQKGGSGTTITKRNETPKYKRKEVVFILPL
jgi:hypothetical protein